jgi:hypothetical protein
MTAIISFFNGIMGRSAKPEIDKESVEDFLKIEEESPADLGRYSPSQWKEVLMLKQIEIEALAAKRRNETEMALDKKIRG